MSIQEFEIEGMSCQHCVGRVRAALDELAGVEIQDLDIGRARLALEDQRVSRSDILAAIQSAGYSGK